VAGDALLAASLSTSASSWTCVLPSYSAAPRPILQRQEMSRLRDGSAAQELRDSAARMNDPEGKQLMLEITAGYDEPATRCEVGEEKARSRTEAA
jgi:hypothetical protein